MLNFGKQLENSIPSFRLRRRLSAWLLGAVSLTAVENENSPTRLKKSTVWRGELKDASATAEFADEVEKAVAVLDSLPDQQSKVIRLSIFGGLSHSQIAETTGASLGTVKTHIRRGLIAMREKIGIPSVSEPEGGLA